MAELREEAAHAALDAGGDRRLAAIERQDEGLWLNVHRGDGNQI